MTAATIAEALGGARREGRDWRCVCPVHGGRSLTLRDGRDGRLLVRCWGGGCDARDVLASLWHWGLLAGRSERARPVPVASCSDNPGDNARRVVLARRIWESAREARGTPVARYLVGRAITIPPPPSIRWTSSLRRPDGIYRPAMVARVDGLDGELIGVHRTWLHRDESGMWRRHGRAMLGRVAAGAVWLAPAAESLLVAEGIETALAAMRATGQPAWAALSTSGIMALRLPPMVRQVIIIADHDRSGAGERAARTAAQQWYAEGRRVQIYISPHVGEDAADRLLATAGEEGCRAA